MENAMKFITSLLLLTLFVPACTHEKADDKDLLTLLNDHTQCLTNTPDECCEIYNNIVKKGALPRSFKIEECNK